jgi:dCMP deaminase
MLVNAGVKRICYGEFYREPKILDWAPRLGIELVQVSLPGAGTPPGQA